MTRRKSLHVNRLVVAMMVMLVAVVVAQGCSGEACSQDSDCAGGESCLYPIGSCSARGTCMTFPNTPGGCGTTAVPCGDSFPLCGCGATVMSGCDYPEGYAGGPTTGEQHCSTPSTPGGPGPAGGVDASTSPEAGDAGEASEAGLPDGSGEETDGE